MPLFRYKALADGGKKITGLIDADSFESAKERLLKQKILVTKLFSIDKTQKETVLDNSLLLSFTREMQQLLTAGLPLYESLLTIEEKYRKSSAHLLFLDLCDKLKGGSSFSSALKKYPKSFDTIYITMVQTGEKTGALPWVFKELHELIARKQKLKKQLISALSYPLFLGGFCFILLMGLLFFVIPSMSELFEGRTLHPVTATVLACSKFVIDNSITLLFSLLSLTGSLIFLFKQPRTKAALFKQLLRLPLIKTVTTEAALVRFSRAVSVLLTGGIPITSALSLARSVMKHPFLEQGIERAEQKIVEGKALSEELKASPHIPPLVVRMLAIAEETGKMPQMFQNIADIYDEQLEKSLTQITTFLQPVLLLTLGAIVGIVILSILLPLTDVSSLISN
ncbi:MAG TPA: type II secretion system F family protein [Rhabdochlamydiaceae bacterium]|nr:type II secretion system F family protein [Rhabdochlamydiaceae bacterium]